MHWLISLASAAALATTTASISPGDDFDAWANASWAQANPIPAGRSGWNARDEIALRTQQQVIGLMTLAGVAPSGTTERKIADFRTADITRAWIEAHGLEPLKPVLTRIDEVRDRGDLARLLGSWMRADADPMNVGTCESAHFLGLAAGPGNQGETTNVAFLVQGGLGLEAREPYLDPAAATKRDDYQRYLARLLELDGFDRASERAGAVLRLETAIARTHATAEVSADERNGGNLWRRADFNHEAPGMDWTAFFDAAGLGSQEAFVVWQPDAVRGGAALVASQPLEAWRDYLRLRALDEHAAVLPRPFADAHADVHGPFHGDAVLEAMSGPIGQVYSQRHFPEDQKARVKLIARNVTAAFRRRVAAASWMSEASRQVALRKIDAVYFGIGYPDRWPDYSSLVIRENDPIGNRLRLAEWNYRETLARVGRPVDRGTWWISPQTPGAVLLFNQNAYNFAAALLQPPKYDASASDAANYGAIGAIVGHELSHFVDTLGADYDATGRKVRWWTAADLAGYEAATAPLARQYSNYSIPTGEHLDGKLMLVENVADLAGLSAAFDAYRTTLGDRIEDRQYRRQQDREFFSGFARAWRSQYSEEGLRKRAASDHAPEKFRIATVRNLDAWYEAFDVRPGQKLYLEPRARVRVW